jgi:hypothetical protein
MTASTVREWIVESINRIVSGETFTQEDFDAQPRLGWEEIKPKPGIVIESDREPAYFAWMALRWWVNDDDVRAKDSEYGEMRKRELEGFLEQMEQRSASR